LDEARPRLPVADDVAWRATRLARDLRRRQTPSEALLWDALRARHFHGLKFRRQQSVGRFVVDFYCAEERLAVEIDGSIHCGSDQITGDVSRQQAIESADIRFVRVTSNLVMNDLADALRIIAIALGKQRKNHPSPHEGEGQGAIRRPG
jgi:very-short-patch-repair endonuclease